MRILLTADTVGGVWTFTQELAEGLLQRGHAVTLATFGRMPSDAQNAWLQAMGAEYAAGFGTMCTSVPLEWMEKNQSAWSLGSRLLLELAARTHFDILHSNQFCYGALDVNMPRLITAHSDVRSWERASCTVPLEESEWLDTYLDVVTAGLRGAHALVAPTRWMLDAMTSLYSDLPVYQQVISNGRTLPPAVANEPRKLQAVSVGRLWDKAKNVAVLADVHSPMPLLIAGDQQLEAATAPARLGQVICLGPLTPAALHDVLRSTALYIATSVYEPFGLAPLEAALCGCALLLNDIPSLREVWAESALYFRGPEELSCLLHMLAKSPADLAQLQRAAAERALHFTAGQMIESYESLYAELIEAYQAGQQTVSEATHVH